MKRTMAAVLAATAMTLTGCGTWESAEAEPQAAVASAEPAVEQVDPEQLMFDACVVEVTGHLRSPASAVFPTYDTARYETPDPSGYHDTRVYGYVDAQNGFGALLRTTWSCSVSMSADGTEVEGLGRLVVDGTPYSD